MAEKLRHGLTCLSVSEIAEQFYCEQKVHLKRTNPQVEFALPSLEIGKAGHEALEGQTKAVTNVEIQEHIRADKKLDIPEYLLEGEFEGVTIRGRADLLSIEGKSALLLLDFKFCDAFKFSKARSAYRDQRAQAQIYSLLLDRMGYATENLCYGIAMFPSKNARGATATKVEKLQTLKSDGVLREVREKCEQKRTSMLASCVTTGRVGSETWKAFLHRYEQREAAENLTWALQYWLSRREPLAVGQLPWDRLPGKCSKCAMNAARLCEHALQEPDASFEVERNAGRVSVFQ